MSAVIVNQDGVILSHEAIRQDRFNRMKDFVDSKTEEFEKALEAEALKRDEVYNDLGTHPRFKGKIYQVGMQVYTINMDGDVPYAEIVGQIGH